MDLDEITEKIIGGAIEVHRFLGPGLLESGYQECLAFEMAQRGLRFKREVSLPVIYKGIKLDCGYRLDFVVEDSVVVEAKAVEAFAPIHEAQLLSYLKHSGCKVGLLLNFHAKYMKDGIRRMVNGV